MIGIDTDLLVDAHRADAPRHGRAQALLRPAVQGELGTFPRLRVRNPLVDPAS